MDEEEFEKRQKKRRAEMKKQNEAQQAQEQLKTALRMALDEEAYNRITNVQHANASLFMVAAQNLLALYKRVGRRLRDEEVLALLQRIKGMTEIPTNIRFQRK